MVSRSLDYEKGLSQLMSMFPQFDKELIEIILESNSNIVETTIDSLIVLANETYGKNDSNQNKDGMISMFNNKNEQKKVEQVIQKPKEEIKVKSLGYNDSRYKGSVSENNKSQISKEVKVTNDKANSIIGISNKNLEEKPKTFIKTVKDGFYSKTILRYKYINI